MEIFPRESRANRLDVGQGLPPEPGEGCPEPRAELRWARESARQGCRDGRCPPGGHRAPRRRPDSPDGPEARQERGRESAGAWERPPEGRQQVG
eukprot:13901693-Alexandrium_andersonii.AAC.1